MKIKLLLIALVSAFVVAVPAADSFLLCCEKPPANLCAPQDGDWTPPVYVLGGKSFPSYWYYHVGDQVVMNYGSMSARFECRWNRVGYDVYWAQVGYGWWNSGQPTDAVE